MVQESVIWQVGCGDANRPYEQFFFDRGVALLGPGTAGRWSESEPAYEGRSDIRDFARTAEPGDLVVAKRGLRQALGVGVLGEYDHSESFEGVGGWGWDLQHYRRVNWLWKEPHLFEQTAFIQGRWSRCHKQCVRQWIDLVLGPEPDLEPPGASEPLPPAEKSLDLASIENKPLRKVVLEARWWQESISSGDLGDTPSESELLAHLTIPLLLALGWKSQQIAVGWKWTDLALFDPYPRVPLNCRIVVEGKRVHQGLFWAAHQAKGYVERNDLSESKVLTTDGIHYRLHHPPDYGEGSALWANLAWPKESADRLFDELQPGE